jgi:hypothetical protein
MPICGITKAPNAITPCRRSPKRQNAAPTRNGVLKSLWRCAYLRRRRSSPNPANPAIINGNPAGNGTAVTGTLSTVMDRLSITYCSVISPPTMKNDNPAWGFKVRSIVVAANTFAPESNDRVAIPVPNSRVVTDENGPVRTDPSPTKKLEFDDVNIGEASALFNVPDNVAIRPPSLSTRWDATQFDPSVRPQIKSLSAVPARYLSSDVIVKLPYAPAGRMSHDRICWLTAVGLNNRFVPLTTDAPGIDTPAVVTKSAPVTEL